MQDPASAPLNDASSLRRTPNQRRSKERVENMLNCAIALIEENGSDAMRMSDVAKRAGVSIGSLYQYFPDKSAIIQTLAERYNAQGKDCIKSGLAHVRTVDELCDAFGALVDEYYALFLAEPVMRDIWSGTQADKALRDIELANSRDNGADLAAVLARFASGLDAQERDVSAFLVMHLGEATMRLAISVERDEGEKLVAGYKRMALAELRRIVCD
ncbi:TetR/AcrR family transcriptional regulator [Magnetovibrio sp.]|uniref:TetR/AcrR family transcriptional regulator n=1 Tax=Magnetovibrio sp. TaxID=2024836 RepID=UPI002F93B547